MSTTLAPVAHEATGLPSILAYEATRGRYQIPPHIAMIEDAAMAELGRGNGRLVVTLPPRHGKSEFLSHWLPTWFLGCYPEKRVMLLSYETDFAQSWGAKVRDSLEVVGPSLFGVHTSDRSSSRGRWDIAGHAGGMFAVGVGGAITGRGADLLILDDPVKNAEQARSETAKSAAWEWWKSTVYTRLEPGATALAIGTRWAEDDLIGKILEDDTEKEWRLLDLPALAEEDDALGREKGEALWPARYPRARLLRIQRRLGGHWWNALFQGRPSPIGGGMFRKDWIRRYRWEGESVVLPTGQRWLRRQLAIFATVDVADSVRKSADWTVVSTWARTPVGQLLLLDSSRIRLEGPDQPVLMKAVYARWHHAYLGVEDVTFGTSLLKGLRRTGQLPMISLKPDKDKVTRALPAAALYQGGQVFHPIDSQLPEPLVVVLETDDDGNPVRTETVTFDLDAFEGEMVVFPNGAHDDQVDTASYAGEALMKWPGEGPADEDEVAVERSIGYGTAAHF